jgi:hypothetical protein
MYLPYFLLLSYWGILFSSQWIKWARKSSLGKGMSENSKGEWRQ